MEFSYTYKHKWSILLGLILLPNLLSVINLSVFGLKVHLFQYAIFLSAMLYGPFAGLASGVVGSFYSAIFMHNPYIIVGNGILGLFMGIFAKKMNPVLAAAAAYAIQLPWLIVSDYYFMHLPSGFIFGIAIALAVSNLVWAYLASKTAEAIQ